MKKIKSEKYNGRFTNEEELEKAIIEELKQYYDVAERLEEIESYLNDKWENHNIFCSKEETCEIIGKEEEGWIRVFIVYLFEYYKESASDEKIYEVKVVTV